MSDTRFNVRTYQSVFLGFIPAGRKYFKATCKECGERSLMKASYSAARKWCEQHRDEKHEKGR